MSSDIKQLIHQRGQIKARLTRFKSYFKAFAEHPDLVQLKLRLAKVAESWQQFEAVQSLIEYEDQTQTQEDEREEFETSYFSLMSEVESFISQNASTTDGVSTAFNGQLHPHASIKLPTLTLPTFSGAYDQWMPFHDTFHSVIHTNQSLSGVQKFQYLISTLKSDAAQVIQALEISNDNYEIAWELLKQRYENKRWMVQSHIKALFELPTIAKESHGALRNLLDCTLKHMRALKTLKQPVEHWDGMLVHLTTSKFDAVTRREWESTSTDDGYFSMDEVIAFLTHKCQLLEVLHSGKSDTKHQATSSIQPGKAHHRGSQSLTSQVGPDRNSCPQCTQNHQIFQCPEFLKCLPEQRAKLIKNLKLCFNCLKETHRADQCKAGTCRKCSSKHNTLLHFNSVVSTASSDQRKQDTSSATTVSTHTLTEVTDAPPYIMLSTALVEIQDTHGMPHICRALLDSGSQSNFLTKACCLRLGLKTSNSSHPIVGISGMMVNVTQVATVKIKSRFNAFSATLRCLVLPKISGNLPRTTFNSALLEIPEGLRLADPQFNISSEVDLLIGAGLFYDLLCIGQIRKSKHLPILQKTQLGWVISGGIECTAWKARHDRQHCNLSLDDQLVRFWQLEECVEAPIMTKEETLCEKHFVENVTRDDQGRFTVKLPIRDEVGKLGESREIAFRRLKALERRLDREPAIKQPYFDFMEEYLKLGHMKKVNETTRLDAYHLPHHAVMKDTSTTTKLRVVFDASCKSSSGISLNDLLMVGPTIQQDIYALVTRFRTHRFVLSADIEKMYRQIKVDPEQTHLQTVLWRKNPEATVDTYQLTTVTYGTSAAPFLAIRCLRQLAIEEGSRSPVAAKALRDDFYVDDLLTGAESMQTAVTLRDQLIAICATAGFHLRKWTSNESQLLVDLPADDVSTASWQIGESKQAKTLGLMWNPCLDILQYTVQLQPSARVSKRTILSVVAHIFDPLGLVGPVILKAKIIMQKLWQLKLGWDETIPIGVHTEWANFEHQLTDLNMLCINRRVLGDESANIQLHGFCDASEAAYGACIYIRTTDHQGNNTVHLLCSRSKVAPLKTVSLPRLELCGALLLARLTQKTLGTLGVKIDQQYFWTDSTIVLAWLAAPAGSWKTFVANRVSEIQGLTQPQNWNHVISGENPADHASRGLTPDQLRDKIEWWHGPNWLKNGEQTWPVTGDATSATEVLERKTTAICMVAIPDLDLFQRYSTLSKLQRIVAWCCRFFTNCRVDLAQRCSGPLTVEELSNALNLLIMVTQYQGFGNDICHLKNKGTLHVKSKLSSLHPFLDRLGLLRVGGRLHNAPISYDRKHQILLPSGHPFTKLLLRHEHVKQLHAGPQLLLAAVRTKFWPLSARNAIRQVVRTCVTCFRIKPIGLSQLMGSLPAGRVTPSRPFSSCGVDYCGPFHLRLTRRRGVSKFKTYLAIFVCFATRAVHLELAADLTTAGFLAVLKRFIARRGKCQHIFSDNATNFCGARGELADLEQLFQSEKHQNSITKFLAEDKIAWHCIPARSPHFGGLWEAAVKSAKHHIRRVAGTASLTMDEMQTLIVQVEACMNSRPITPMSEDPSDLECLTPGHFLVGGPLTAIMEPDLIAIKQNRLTHWQRVQQLLQHFWTRWSLEYLSQVQQRSKWKLETTVRLDPGMLVILKDDNLPPLKWSLGRIVELYPGQDGLVRTVSVQTKGGVVTRAITKICVLPLEKDTLT